MTSSKHGKDDNQIKTLRGKRLLILGGPVQSLKVVQACKDMGIYAIVTDIEECTEAKRAADEALPISVMDTDALIEWCSQHPVDGALNFNIDFAQHSHQKICEHFGFPCYGNKEQYRLLTDKKAFKQLCYENGVGTIADYKEDDLNDNCYPVLVKPAESSSSRGSFICRSESMLKEAIEYAQRHTRNGSILIEKYIYGKPDLEVAYYVHHGEPYLLYVGDRYTGSKDLRLDRICTCFIVPSKLTDCYVESAHKKVCEMIKRIGLNDSPVFFQCFYDNNEFLFYDMAIRFPGDEFISVLKKVNGLDFVREMIRYALTGQVLFDDEQLTSAYMMCNHFGALILTAIKPGVVSSFEGMEAIRKLPTTVAAVQKKHVGDIIEHTGDLRQRACEIALVVQGDVSKLKEAIVKTESLLSIKDENGKSMITSHPDLVNIDNR